MNYEQEEKDSIYSEFIIPKNLKCTTNFTPPMDIEDNDWTLEIRPIQDGTMIYDLLVVDTNPPPHNTDESNPNKRYSSPNWDTTGNWTHWTVKRDAMKEWNVDAHFETENYTPETLINWLCSFLPNCEMDKDFRINYSQLIDIDKKFHHIIICGEHKVIKYVILDGVKHCKGDETYE